MFTFPFPGVSVLSRDVSLRIKHVLYYSMSLVIGRNKIHTGFPDKTSNQSNTAAWDSSLSLSLHALIASYSDAGGEK